MDCIVETPNGGAEKCYQFVKKTLEFLVLVSIFYSYFSGFHFFFSYNLQLSTLIFPLFARVLDRKYMFLIFNGILGFLAKNLKLSSSSLNHSGFIKSAEDGVKQITELPSILEEATVQENVAAVVEEQTVQQHEEDYADMDKETKTARVIIECEDREKRVEQDV